VRLNHFLVVLAMMPVFVSLPALADQPLPPAAGETVSVIRSSSGGFEVHVTDRGASLQSVFLNNPQFIQEQDEAPAGGPIPPAAKMAPGPLDIVTTWENGLYPLSIGFEDVSSSLTMGRIVELPPAPPAPVEADATGSEAVGQDAGTPEARVADAAGLTVDPAAAPVAPIEPPAPMFTTEPVPFWEAFSSDPVFKVVSTSADSVVMVWPDPAVYSSPLYIERRFTIREDFVLDAVIRLVNVSDQDVQGRLIVSIPGWESPVSRSGFCGGMFGAPPDVLEAVCSDGSDIDRKKRKEILDSKNFGISGKASYVGITSRYFLTAAIPSSESEVQCVAGATPSGIVNGAMRWANESGGRQLIKAVRPGGCVPGWLAGAYGMEGRMSCAEAAGLLGVDETISPLELSRIDSDELGAEAKVALDSLKNRRERIFSTTVYAGPKDLNRLKTVASGLEDTIDFGWTWFLARPMLWLMKFVYNLLPSWGIAIIFLTIVVKLLTMPLTLSSTRQMRRMAELKPKIDELQKRYKDDKAKLNQATMELYKREKINPMGGCLPMLIQMPVWIALYRTIYSAVDLYQAPLGLWIRDLSTHDPYFVLPLILGGAMFLNQKLTPVTGDPAQAKIMLWMMPIMFTAMMLFLPSGLVFYILVNTLLSVLQTLWNNRAMKKKRAAAA